MAVTPQVKAAVDQLLGLWGTSNSKGSHQRVIRDFTNAADDVPVDTTGGTDEQRLQWAMKVLQGGTEAFPFFSKKGAGGWESASTPLTRAYAPAAKIAPEWVPDYVQFDEGGVPSQGPVDYNRWAQIAPQLGYRGVPIVNAGDDGLQPTADFVSFVDQKRAEGYDFVKKRSNIHNYNNYYGFKLPSGEVVAQSKTGDDDDIKSFFTEFLLPAGLTAFTMGGGLNSLMGGGAAAAPANALTGTGLGAMEGVGLTGNIVNAATGQTIASLPAAAAASAPIFDLGGNVINPVTSEVLLPASAAPGTLPSLTSISPPPAPPPISPAEVSAVPPTSVAEAAGGAVESALPPAVESALPPAVESASVPATSPYSLSSGTTSGTTGITPGVGGTTGITPVTTTPLGAAAGTAIDLAPSLGASLGATASALGVGATLGTSAGATTSALAPAAPSAISSLLNPSVVSGVANVIGGVTSANAAEEAAATQTAAAVEAARIQAESAKEVARLLIEADKEAYARQLAERKPLQDIGMGALRRIEAGLAPGGEFARPFQMGDVLGSERYRTLQEAGRGAVEQSAFSRGMGMSTPAALNLTDLGQRLGVSEYDRTLAQLQAEREAVLRPLQSLSGLGITETRALGDIAAQSAATRGQAAAGAAGSIDTTGANALLSGAGSTAAGQIQAGNIMGQTISNVGNIALQMDYLGRLFGGPNVRLPMSSGGL